MIRFVGTQNKDGLELLNSLTEQEKTLITNVLISKRRIRVYGIPYRIENPYSDEVKIDESGNIVVPILEDW